jgi:uncharacterized protein YjbI with pentapeptide repeats
MPLNAHSLYGVFRSCSRAVLFATITICSGIGGQALAQGSNDTKTPSESWARSQLEQGKAADFNYHCKSPALDPRAVYEPRWRDDCRRIPASFLVNVLTGGPRRQQVPFAGVTIIGARIEGDIDLQNVEIRQGLSVKQSWVEGNVILEAARTHSVINFLASRVAGRFSANQFHSDLSLDLGGSEFKQPIFLEYAQIDGNLNMDGATLDRDMNASRLQVGGSIFMRSTNQNKASFKEVVLVGANVAGNFETDGATFDGVLNGDSLKVGGSIFMRSTEQNKASFKAVRLVTANVALNVEMEGATFDGDLDAQALHVARSLSMRSTCSNHASFKNVTLKDADVTGDLLMDGAKFDGELDAEALHVERSLLMRSTCCSSQASFKKVTLRGAKITGHVDADGATFEGELIANSLQVGRSILMNHVTSTQRINMAFMHTGGSLDVRGATLAELNLSGASIDGDLRLGGGRESKSHKIWRTKEGKPGKLILRNTSVGSLMDDRDAWPEKPPPGEEFLDLDGFTFTHLGGFEGESEHDMRGRGMTWWDGLIRRDLEYTPTPYEQLAAALVAAGDRGAADDIRFLGRVRQREAEEHWLPWIGAVLLEYVAGFGIGDYTFRVLAWVIAISAAGAFYLWKRVPAARGHGRGRMWCFGASLSRLLPVIEINKEFTDFFNDPRRDRLTGWQGFVFSVIEIVGWFLGAILIAAISGLTQKP